MSLLFIETRTRPQSTHNPPAKGTEHLQGWRKRKREPFSHAPSNATTPTRLTMRHVRRQIFVHLLSLGDISPTQPKMRLNLSIIKNAKLCLRGCPAVRIDILRYCVPATPA